MKKLIFAFVILAAGGGYAWYYFAYAKPVEKPQVTRAPVTQGNIVEQVSATGALEPLRRVDVGSQVSGVVKEIYVDFNDIVKKDQVLAQIDPTLLQVQVDIQKANIERQESDIANQKVGLEDLRVQLKRMEVMVASGLQNQQQLEQSQLAVKNREAQILSAQKSLVSSRANLAQAELNVTYTTIKSPIDGVVLERRVDRGQTVQASTSAPSFFILVTPLQQLKLTAGVDEADIGRIRAGMDVSFIVETYGQQQFWGVVEAVRMNATNQNNVVTFPVWIKVDNPDLRLRPSLTASVKIIISQATNVVRVPNAAFRFRPNNDIYTALGLEPPAAGRGMRLGGPDDVNGSTKAGPGTPGAPGAPGTGAAGRGATGATGGQANAGRTGGQDQRAQGGTRGQGGDRTAGGSRGFGAQTNLTPEQLQAMRDRFAAGGGRTGGGRGGGGRGGQNAAPGASQGRGGGGRAQQAAPVSTQEGNKIDEYFQPIPRAEQRQTVWTWDEAKKELKQIQIRVGVTDGTFSELISGDIKVGDELVTGIILPRAAVTAPGSSLFGQPQRGQTPGGDRGGGGRAGGGGGGRGGN
jgi:HlyD family secretion protein